MSSTAAVENAAAMLGAAQNISVLTGAGVSKESGIPTFRDALEGLWANFDPMTLATPRAFMADPKLVWEFYDYRRGLIAHAQPNAGHRALAALERHKGAFPVITQNIDELHEKAGSTNVIHLHGRIARDKCFAACRGEPTLIDREILVDKQASPPRCPYCGAFIRPDVVWFEEMLPADALRAADQALYCDVLLVIGTSGVVYPAANMPFIASQRGAQIIEVNPVSSEITRIADVFVPAPSGEALPQIVSLVGQA